MAKDKQAELQKTIEELALETELFEGRCQDRYIEKFKTIYTGDFRHLYSGIFAVITKLNEEQKVNLEQNLSLIHQKVESQSNTSSDYDEELCKSLRKLHDHVSLDISRMNYWNRLQREYDDKFNETRRWQIELDEKIDRQKKKVAKLVKRLENAKNEYITILGIFVAIILGAVGSLTYAGKVLEGASNQQTDLTRLIIIAIVLGAVLVSAANTFLSFILKVNGKEECFKGWSWSECMWLIVIAGAVAIGAAKLLGV